MCYILYMTNIIEWKWYSHWSIITVFWAVPYIMFHDHNVIYDYLWSESDISRHACPHYTCKQPIMRAVRNPIWAEK